jgi:DNA processing protein
LLYVHGVLPTPPPEGKTPLTIVGARTSTARGRAFAAELARAVARRGGLAVSGLAIGIDQAAHEGALEGGGPSVAVVACGLDRIYPPGAEPLARRLASNGAVVSEMPIGTAPWKSHFPRRNRLLAAWSRATLVIEADLASGSLITARRALELGRDVLAMPGPIDAPTSRGTNRLIRDGAHPLLEVADVDLLLPAAKSRGEAATVNSHAAGAPVADDELLAALATPMALDALSTAFGLSTGDLAVRLVDLEAARAVRRLAGGLWGRT